MTIAVKRVAASGWWESMSMNLAKWGSLPPVVAARIVVCLLLVRLGR
jgi:hypothetical protein